ncbi:MAG: hypothetical protein HQL58_12110 [Magnetococcales bacterium]|nr:hypothetical protein [Magnetococcales bacterium]
MTGRNSSTIHRAMQSGKVSYTVNANGERVIDLAELERVYGLKPQDSQATQQTATDAVSDACHSTQQVETLATQLQWLQEKCNLLQQELSHWRNLATMLAERQTRPRLEQKTKKKRKK